MRRTKIICTLGPACAGEEMLRTLVSEGMNAARFNFSHGNHETHLKQLLKLREICAELNAPVAALLDTKGPEIRVGAFEEPVELVAGDSFTLTAQEVTGSASEASVTYRDLHKELSPGSRILVDDGAIELCAERVEDCKIICTVINGGAISSNKSINIPDVNISLPTLTERDRADIRFAAENGFDYIAQSFVRRASDVLELREFLHECGGRDILVIAKIENREGVDNLDEIAAEADGIMVARGDLGVEIPEHEVPVIQKRIVSKCAQLGKPVIIATQMLDSMIRSPRPTRAEVSDVANAVFECASCVMLSGETASGKYPAESLRAMVDTIAAAESSIDYWQQYLHTKRPSDGTVSDAISRACCLTAMDLDASAILAATTSGHTARMISRYKPGCEIIALTTSERVRRKLSLFWGVRALMTGHAESTDELLAMCVMSALDEGVIKKGETVIITAGVPVGRSGTTNLIRARVVK